MKRPSPLFSVAVVISALSPAAILAFQIWGGPTWPGILKREVISFRIIKDASPLSIPSLPASATMFAYVKPQFYTVELINSIP